MCDRNTAGSTAYVTVQLIAGQKIFQAEIPRGQRARCKPINLITWCAQPSALLGINRPRPGFRRLIVIARWELGVVFMPCHTNETTGWVDNHIERSPAHSFIQSSPRGVKHDESPHQSLSTSLCLPARALGLAWHECVCSPELSSSAVHAPTPMFECRLLGNLYGYRRVPSGCYKHREKTGGTKTKKEACEMHAIRGKDGKGKQTKTPSSV